MPIYEYECRDCGNEHEIIQKMSEGALRKCPSCGALKLRRKISRSAFHLKGDGWYVTDYPKNGKDKNKEADQESSTKSDSSKSESKSETKSETKSNSKSSDKSSTGKSESKKPAGSKSSD